MNCSGPRRVIPRCKGRARREYTGPMPEWSRLVGRSVGRRVKRTGFTIALTHGAMDSSYTSLHNRPMRLIAFLLVAVAPLAAQSSAETDAVAAAQQVFDGMKAHDAAGIASVMLPDARLFALRDTGATVSTPAADFAKQIAGAQGDLIERFTAKPTVLIRGRMAQVWGEYEFLRDGKFHHCGVDSFSLLQTADGWKIAAIVYTSETTGCKGQ